MYKMSHILQWINIKMMILLETHLESPNQSQCKGWKLVRMFPNELSEKVLFLLAFYKAVTYKRTWLRLEKDTSIQKWGYTTPHQIQSSRTQQIYS